MTTIKTVVVAAALLASMGTALAESRTAQAMRQSAPKGVTEAFFACIDKAGFDQALIGTCIKAERVVQDGRLSRAYDQLVRKLDGKAKESVRVAERAWIDFNTKSVAAETDIAGTSRIADSDVAIAELHRYCERANVLEDYLFSAGG
jgi:uncharacterized protein YecT (DUF1311 family)